MSLIFYAVWVAILVALAYFGARADSTGFVTSLFAAAVSIFAVVFIEMELRGRIRILKEPDADAPVLPDGRKFLRVIVQNRKLWWPLRLVMDRRPIYQARASIKFLTEENDPLCEGREMIGRWSNTPEPIRIISTVPGANGTPGITYIRDLSVIRDAVDIACGASEILDIVMRSPNESGSHGWHNRMIENRDPRPEDRFDLPAGNYHALVRVDASGRSFKALFHIVCEGTIEKPKFRLEPLDEVHRGL